MNTVRLKVLVLVAVVSLFALPAFATTITFDEGALANGTPMTNQWVAYGITFSVINGSLYIGSGSGPGGSDIAGRYAVVQSSGGTGNAVVEFHVPGDASTPVYVNGSQVSFSLWDTEASVTVNAYDLSNGFLGSYDLTALYVNGAGGLTGNVHKLVFVDTGNDGHVFDNLTFPTIPPTEIPEPGTFALLGLGLIGLGITLRRRRA